jgi:hypothetical protein
MGDPDLADLNELAELVQTAINSENRREVWAQCHNVVMGKPYHLGRLAE